MNHIYCQDCGSKNARAANFCTKCGTSMKASSEKPRENERHYKVCGRKLRVVADSMDDEEEIEDIPEISKEQFMQAIEVEGFTLYNRDRLRNIACTQKAGATTKRKVESKTNEQTIRDFSNEAGSREKVERTVHVQNKGRE